MPIYELMTDQQLCDRLLKKQDQRAGDALFKRHIGWVTGYLKNNFSRIEHEAVASEILRGVLTYLGRQELKTNFMALVRKAAERRGRKEQQGCRERDEKEVPYDDSLDSAARRHSNDPMDAVVSESAMFELVKEALKLLSKYERAVFLRGHLDGLTVREISIELGKTESAIRTCQYQIRKKLKADPHLARFCRDEGGGWIK